jgi:hypothetical protein
MALPVFGDLSRMHLHPEGDAFWHLLLLLL